MLAGEKMSYISYLQTRLILSPVWMPGSWGTDADVLLELIILALTK